MDLKPSCNTCVKPVEDQSNVISIRQKDILNIPTWVMIACNTLNYLIKPSIATTAVKCCSQLQQ